jgi:hypothetical protein
MTEGDSIGSQSNAVRRPNLSEAGVSGELSSEVRAVSNRIHMKRWCFAKTDSPDIRLADEATRFREQARLLAPGPEKDDMIRRARRVEMVASMNAWLQSAAV